MCEQLFIEKLNYKCGLDDLIQIWMIILKMMLEKMGYGYVNLLQVAKNRFLRLSFVKAVVNLHVK
jgi:hypothetical protein